MKRHKILRMLAVAVGIGLAGEVASASNANGFWEFTCALDRNGEPVECKIQDAPPPPRRCHLRDNRGFEPGDLNCDGAVNNFDIDAFVLALSDPLGYATDHPGCPRCLADVNHDGEVDNFDISPFLIELSR